MDPLIAKTSPFKKNSKSYHKDHIFDIIDVEHELYQDIIIPFCKSEHYLYNLFEDEEKKLRESLLLESQSLERNYDLEYEDKNGTHIPLKSEFIFYKVLGTGSYGSVISVYDKKLRTKAALKIIKKENLSINEINLPMMMDHFNIIKLYRVLRDSEHVYLVMELMEGGSLKNLIQERYIKNQPFKESEISMIINGILDGLIYMHSNNIIHRDIKPENIMFRDKSDLSSVTIGDFGLSDVYEDPQKIFCGTKIYMAPELFNGIKSTHKIDVWALGYIIYILCSGGRHPIIDSVEKRNEEWYIKTLEKIKSHGWKFNEEFPILARNLFLKLCKYDSTKRFELFFAKNHPWITRKVGTIPYSTFEHLERNRKIREFSSVIFYNLVFRKCYDSTHV